KGVSPVIATVLMVAVAIAAAVVAYSWFMSMQASVQAEASRGAGTIGKERFAVSSIFCDESNYLHFVIQNMGDEPVNNANITVYVKNADTSEVNASTKVSNQSFPASNPQEVNTGIPCSNLPDNVIVEVHLPGGSVVSGTARIR
ncbi:MAG: hypothetical protein PWP76_733, partial [Candidatus Diapherotrites archaeon]|nr:hypothetical protein [Candidatus Diapherotrites archaeon]